MRIEKVELNKIKVTVYPIDLDNMDISINSLTPDSPQLHSFLLRIMEKIEEETGFNPYTGQVMVKASPKDDCMILTVTKLSDKKPTRNLQYKGKKVRAVLKNQKRKRIIYGFESFDDMCESLVFCEDEILKTACCYKIEGNFILLVENSTTATHSLMKEFATFCDSSIQAAGFLGEHAQIIAKNDELLNMANKLREFKGIKTE